MIRSETDESGEDLNGHLSAAQTPGADPSSTLGHLVGDVAKGVPWSLSRSDAESGSSTGSESFSKFTGRRGNSETEFRFCPTNKHEGDEKVYDSLSTSLGTTSKIGAFCGGGGGGTCHFSGDSNVRGDDGGGNDVRSHRSVNVEDVDIYAGNDCGGDYAEPHRPLNMEEEFCARSDVGSHHFVNVEDVGCNVRGPFRSRNAEKGYEYIVNNGILGDLSLSNTESMNATLNPNLRLSSIAEKIASFNEHESLSDSSVTNNVNSVNTGSYSLLSYSGSHQLAQTSVPNAYLTRLSSDAESSSLPAVASTSAEEAALMTSALATVPSYVVSSISSAASPTSTTDSPATAATLSASTSVEHYPAETLSASATILSTLAAVPSTSAAEVSLSAEVHQSAEPSSAWASDSISAATVSEISASTSRTRTLVIVAPISTTSVLPATSTTASALSLSFPSTSRMLATASETPGSQSSLSLQGETSVPTPPVPEVAELPAQPVPEETPAAVPHAQPVPDAAPVPAAPAANAQRGARAPNLNELRDRMFFQLFLRLMITYARSTTPRVRRVLEFLLLLKGLFCLGLLTSVHVLLSRHAPECLPQNITWDNTGILRVEVLNAPGDDYSLAMSYKREELLQQHLAFEANGGLFYTSFVDRPIHETLEALFEEAEQQQPEEKVVKEIKDSDVAFIDSLLNDFHYEPHVSVSSLDNMFLNSSSNMTCPAPVTQNPLLEFASGPVCDTQCRADALYRLEIQDALYEKMIGSPPHIMEYSMEYGLLRLSVGARRRLMVPVTLVLLDPARLPQCFGRQDSVSAALINDLVGYDELLLTGLKQLAENDGGKGFLRNAVTGEHFRFVSLWLVGSSYVAALFVMGVFTLSVSLLLRYSHHQIFMFIVHVLNLMDHNPAAIETPLPCAPMLTVILALIGMEAVMSEFFKDTSTAFYVIVLVWCSNQYDTMCCTQPITQKHWLRFFFLYHFAFYAYHYRFNGQYSWLALMTSWFFIEHSMLYFFHHYELPVTLRTRPRLQAINIVVRRNTRRPNPAAQPNPVQRHQQESSIRNGQDNAPQLNNIAAQASVHGLRASTDRVQLNQNRRLPQEQQSLFRRIFGSVLGTRAVPRPGLRS